MPLINTEILENYEEGLRYTHCLHCGYEVRIWFPKNDMNNKVKRDCPMCGVYLTLAMWRRRMKT